MVRVKGLFVLIFAALSTSTASFSLDLQPEELEIYDPKRFNFIDLELLQAVCNENKNDNVMISPTSIKIILTILAEGAAGTTADELKTVLRLPKDTRKVRDYLQDVLRKLKSKSDGVVVEIGNRVYINDRLTPKTNFANVLREYYNSDVVPLNFASQMSTSNHINGWVNSVTHGLIPQLIAPGALRTDTSAIAMNVMFFKGTWHEAFDERMTKPTCFHLASGGCHTTSMMESVSTYNYSMIDELDAQAVSIPYKDNAYSMLILLSNKINGVKQLLRDISYVPIHKIAAQLSPAEVVLSLPRFQIEYATDLVPTLQSLRINEVFTPNANLTGMVNGVSGVYVNNVIHKTKIEVNERGTVAAAASAAVVVPLMGSTKPLFRADHPFLFFIRHLETGTTMFAGMVNVPEAAAPARESPKSTNYQRHEQVQLPDSYNQQTEDYSSPPYTSSVNSRGQQFKQKPHDIQSQNRYYNSNTERELTFSSN